MKFPDIKDGAKTFWKDIQADLFACFVFSVVLLVIYPAGVYQQNASAVIFNLSDLWGEIFLRATLLFTICAFTSILFWQAFKVNLSPVFATLWLCLWTQGNLLDYNLGTMNGQPVEWNRFVFNFFGEIAVWFMIFGAGFYFRNRIKVNTFFIFAAILIFEGSPLLINNAILQLNGNLVQKMYYDKQQEFEYSTSQNVIILILDSTRGTLAANKILGDNSLRSTFKDFTLYENASAGYPTTKPSMPLILSGVYNLNQTPYEEYIQSTLELSISYFLKQNGFSIEYYSSIPFIYTRIWDNAKPAPSKTDVDNATSQLYLVSFLRYSPLPFKPFLREKYFSAENYWTKNMVDFHNNANLIENSRNEPVFKLIHLTGAHPPYQLNEFAERVEGSSSYEEQLTAGLVIAADFIEELKRGGAYDNSLILIVSDHGATEPSDDLIMFQQAPPDMMLTGIPLIMAKEPGQTQTALNISDAPVSLADISKSVLSSLEIENNNTGVSIFSDIPQDRERFYYHYEWTNLDWNAPYLPELIEYKIIGDVRKEESWIRTGNIFTGGKRGK